MGKKNKNRMGVVYSTDPDFEYTEKGEEQQETLLPEEQHLKVYIDRRHRKGKVVTVVDNFVGTDDDLKDLGKMLKQKCAVGGSEKDGQIIIQGDFRKRIKEILIEHNYEVVMH